MTAKELERLVADHGGNASALDVVTRRLRAAFALRTAGRGLSARSITIDEAAWILAAYAGSEVAAKADQTLTQLIGLTGRRDFILDLQLALRGDLPNVLEFRIARNAPRAVVRYIDGAEEEYLPRGSGRSTPMFLSEGVLSAKLLDLVRMAGAPWDDDDDDEPDLIGELTRSEVDGAE